MKAILRNFLETGKYKVASPVTIQSRVAIGGLLSGKDSVVGLGARPDRAGSIGRDTSAHGEFTGPPPQEAGGASPCPIYGEISALWFQAEWTGAQTMGTLGIHVWTFLLQNWLLIRH